MHTDAMNASQLLDAIVSVPAWNQSIFTDSIQLFPSNILSEARLYSGPQRLENYYGEGTFSEISVEIQESLKKTRQDLVDAASQNPKLVSKLPRSSTLSLDPAGLQSFDRASLQLVRSMQDFEDTYNRQMSSHVEEYSSHHLGDSITTIKEDTIPGLGQAARDLNVAQEEMLKIIKNVCDLQDSVAQLAGPSSEIQMWIEQAKKELLRSCPEESSVQAMLDRLSAMSAILERARQRITANKTI
ncbi:hypothetical protein BGZ49_009286 [Haplosporangium sp. Z 27]|nr:hypothetical protein BGZ49_009286 [Haplosporangium sp. Z 27]